MNVRPLAGAVAAVAIATAGTFLIYAWIEPSVSLLFFPAVVVTAIFGGYGAALLASVLSTVSLACYFVPPRYVVAFGIDDVIRLLAFGAVSLATAWLSATRRGAQEAERRSVDELRAAVATLRRISEWPPIGGPDFVVSIGQVMRHAADALRAEAAVAAWETADEPWLYVARSSAQPEAFVKLSPQSGQSAVAPELEGSTFVTDHALADASVIVKRDGVLSTWRGTALGPALRTVAPELAGSVVSASFRSEHVGGRLFLAGAPDADARVIPLADLVAREVSNSVEELYLADRARDLAVREDRLRVSRDLHDGVLQALTGIRLELQAMSDGMSAETADHGRLLSIERALATEQRELRLFIDQLKPATAPAAGEESLRVRLEEMCSRLSAEWRVPVSLRVVPQDCVPPPALERALRLMIHEAVVNALKHAQPARVAVTIVRRPGDIHVTVSDDGRGFPFRGTLDHEALAARNLGPVTLRQRVTALGGRLQIESSLTGSRLEFSIPAESTGG